jgi:glucokinase
MHELESAPRITGDKSAYLERIVLNIVRDRKRVSRTEINRVTGIRLSTITEVARRLLRKGCIIEAWQQETDGKSRGKKELLLNPAYRNVVGIEVESNEVAAVLADFCGGILLEERLSIDASYSREAILDVVFALADRMLAAAAGREILGIGVATIGMIDLRSDTVLFTSRLPNWKDVRLKEIVGERYSLPVEVADQVIAKLHAERWLEDAGIRDSAVFVDLGETISASVYYNRHVLKSLHGSVGEIGHFCVSPEQKRCTCGNSGCLQTVASAGVILKSVQDALREGTMSILNDMSGNDPSRITIPMILQAAGQGDRISENILANAAHYIGKSISYVVNLLCPGLIILGGDLIKTGDYLANLIIAEMKRNSLHLTARNLRVRTASNPDRGGVLGAVCLALDDFFRQPEEKQMPFIRCRAFPASRAGEPAGPAAPIRKRRR